MNRWYVAAGISALAVGVLFLLVGDGTGGGSDVSGWRFVVLQYFHALTWLLLGTFFLLQAKNVTGYRFVGYAALACYIIFIATKFIF